jgi:hypothetical protein
MPALLDNRQACQARIAELKDGIASIKVQIATADLARQAKGGRMDAGWFNRAKTALRHKQRELEEITAKMAALPGGKNGLKDCLLEVLREGCDEMTWRAALDEAHRRHAGGA